VRRRRGRTAGANVRVLIVEDSVRLRRTIETALTKSGYAVDATGDGLEGLTFAESTAYDAIVLDIMLPALDGLSLLRRLRAQGKPTHILLLTAKDTVQDRVRGLDAGADDYLIKPFALEELLARVAALCRRTYGHKQVRLVIADLEIDMTAKEVSRAGQPIALKPREYALLEYLALRHGEVVSRRDIETHIYDGRVDTSSNVIDSAVSVLRKRLGRPGAPPLIHTRYGLGYILKAEPE
jgi:DNA-binding response OmpR family regulator